MIVSVEVHKKDHEAFYLSLFSCDVPEKFKIVSKAIINFEICHAHQDPNISLALKVSILVTGSTKSLIYPQQNEKVCILTASD